MRPHLVIFLVVVAIVLMSGLGAILINSEPRRSEAPSETVLPPAATLSISYQPSSGDAEDRSLRCSPPAGDVPSPAAACEALAILEQAKAILSAEPRCSDEKDPIGRQTISITGRWDGRRVDISWNRDNACLDGRFREIAAALGIDYGAVAN